MSPGEFAVEYENAIKKYISNGKEDGLNNAYELGRKALENPDMFLSTIQLHSEILQNLLNESNLSEDRSRINLAATSFFLEFLSPVQMTLNSFWDVVANLNSEIEKRHHTEEALEYGEKYHKALIGNTLDIISILDPNGSFKYYSPAVKQVLGYKQKELIGQNAFSYIHPDDLDMVLDAFKRIVSFPDHTETVEFRFKGKSGDWVILESIGKNLISDPIINGIIINSRDVTDRRYLEEVRRKYEFIVNASNEVMTLVNSYYQYEAVNEAFCVAFSKGKEDIIGKYIHEIFGKDSFENLLKPHIDDAFLFGEEIVSESWFELPAFGKKFIEAVYYPYKNQRSLITHVVIIFHDVTERKIKEDEIKTSQQQLAEAQRIAHLGSWEWDVGTNIVNYSPEICNIFGIPPNSLRLSLVDFLLYIYPDDKPRFEKMLNDAANRQETFILEHRILRSLKSIRILQTRCQIVTDEILGTTKVIGVSQDITKHEIAQQAIRASELKYRRLFETSKEGLLILDAATGVVVDVNQFMIDFIGYSKENLLGKKLWAIQAVENYPETEKAFRMVIEKGYVRYSELDLDTSEGKNMKVELISIAYTANKNKMIQCHLWDITERKKLQLELNKIAKQRNEDLQKYAQTIQHAQEDERRRISRELHDDICQRLTALKFQINIFEDTVQGKKRISLRKLGSVKKEINNLITEVRRISSNLRPLALDHFGLVTALRLLSTEYQKIHKVKINFECSIPSLVRYDPDVEITIFRIAQEALTNCVKHSGVKEFDVKVLENVGNISLVISDNGVGFNPRKKNNHSSSKGNHFGLVNMRERAELLGGKFEVESKQGKGTDLKIIIPLLKGNEHEKN